LGYPNDYDTAHGRTGSFIMMHGKNMSIGCFAMTDPAIEEIYLLAEAALKAGQKKFSVHSFPFRMTKERMEKEAANGNLPFWKELQPEYDWFETKHAVPVIVGGKDGYRIEK
jgi:murein L,D-transpeptidase YafK